MKKTTLLLILIIILIGTGIFLSLNDFLFTGKIIENQNLHSSTIAICNETNYCEDYEVECKGNEIVKMRATGFGIYRSEGWKDPRENHNPENPCS